MIKKYIVETLDGVTQYVQTLGASKDGVFHSVMTCVNDLQDAESALEEAYNAGFKVGKNEERERMIALFSKPLDDHKAFSWEEIGIFAKVAKNIEKQKKADEIMIGDEVQHGDSTGIVYVVGDQILSGLCTGDESFAPFQWYKEECKKTGRRFETNFRQINEEETL